MTPSKRVSVWYAAKGLTLRSLEVLDQTLKTCNLPSTPNSKHKSTTVMAKSFSNDALDTALKRRKFNQVTINIKFRLTPTFLHLPSWYLSCMSVKSPHQKLHFYEEYNCTPSTTPSVRASSTSHTTFSTNKQRFNALAICFYSPWTTRHQLGKNKWQEVIWTCPEQSVWYKNETHFTCPKLTIIN